MPASEFTEFYIAEQVMPFGDRRGDIQGGIIAATIANVFKAYTAGMSKQKFEPVDIDDFMLPLVPRDPRQPQQTPEQQLQIMLAIQAYQNALVAQQKAQEVQAS